MIEETRRLVEHWRLGEPIDGFARRVQEEGLLGNATAYRTRDLVRRVFAPHKGTSINYRAIAVILGGWGYPGLGSGFKQGTIFWITGGCD